MNHSYISLRASLACLSIGLSSVALATPPAFSAGDLLMGFRATGGTGASNSYVVNLGPASTYRDATSAITVNISDIKTDLDTVYGAWYTRTDVLWGIACSPSNTAVVNTDPVSTVYLSKLQNTAGNPGNASTYPVIDSETTRGGCSTRFSAFQGGFHDSNIIGVADRSTTSQYAAIQSNSFTYAWRSYMASGGTAAYTPGGTDFGTGYNIEATPNKSLSLFRLSSNDAGSYEGYFTLSSTGTLTFTPAVAGVSYSSWAAANAGSSSAPANSDYDNDGVQNGVEWFTGSSTNPAVVSGAVTWPRATGNIAPTSVWIQTSPDLAIWTNQGTNQASGSGSISYSLPSGQPKIFVRLRITP